MTQSYEFSHMRAAVSALSLVVICASKYNYHVIELASHYAQEL